MLESYFLSPKHLTYSFGCTLIMLLVLASFLRRSCFTVTGGRAVERFHLKEQVELEEKKAGIRFLAVDIFNMLRFIS